MGTVKKRIPATKPEDFQKRKEDWEKMTEGLVAMKKQRESWQKFQDTIQIEQMTNNKNVINQDDINNVKIWIYTEL